MAAGLLLLGLLAAAEGPPPGSSGVFPYGEVKAGLTATGYTVFEGQSREAFSAQVLGTAESGAAQRRMIICRLTGPRVERTGVLAAMSGSPMYVDGKLLGALAYAWPFSKEPLCGVTPAQDMMDVAARGAAIEARGPAAQAVSLLDFFGRLDAHAAGGEGPFRPVALASGRLGELRDAGFSWTAGGGRGASDTAAPAAPGPGDMIGVQLVSGDVQLTAFGTVTWVDGSRFLAFGHPFLGLGSVELPAVGARVVADVASLQRGFKLATATGPVGVVLQDRPAGVYGTFGPGPKMFSVATEVSAPGAKPQLLRFEVVRHPQLTPALLAGALLTAWSSAEDSSSPRTIRLSGVELKTASGEVVRLQDQAFAGPQVFVAAAEYLSGVVDLLLNNPQEAVPLESLRFAADVQPGIRSSQVETAWLDRDSLRRGDPLQLEVRLQPRQAPARVVSVAVPTGDLPPGPALLWVGNALDVAKKVAATGRDVPGNGREYLDYLSRLPGDEQLAVAVAAKSSGALFQHARVGDLPPSVTALMSRSPSAQAAPAASARTLQVLRVPGTGLVDGVLEVPFQVEDEP